jgi:hypothetical protein
LQPYTMLHISGACEGHQGIRKYPIPHSPTMWFVPMAMKNVGKIMGKWWTMNFGGSLCSDKAIWVIMSI